MYKIGTKIKTRKKHPCGGDMWTVVRNGADYKIKCDVCGRQVILSPDELKKKWLKAFMNRPTEMTMYSFDNNLYGEEDDSLFEKLKFSLFGTILTVLVFAVILRLGVLFTLNRVVVSGESMADTLHSGDVVCVEKYGKAERGDIVIIDISAYGNIFSQKTMESGLIIKRVIALEGDSIYCKNNTVYLKKAGESEFTALEEGYVSSRTPDFDLVEVGEGEAYCLGDNRANSNDSTEAGCFKISEIRGVMNEWWSENWSVFGILLPQTGGII